MFNSRAEESKLKEIATNRSEQFLKLSAFAISIMMITSSVAIIEVPVLVDIPKGDDFSPLPQTYHKNPCQVKSVISQYGTWVSFDSTLAGTPAQANVIVSDTTGITIVADFHGFWRDTYSISSTDYDELDMPGASSTQEPGEPVLPILTELIEIPHEIDVSIRVIATSNDTTSGYSIRPASPLYFPVGVGEDSINGTPPPSPMLPDFFGPTYSNNALFPGVRTTNRGRFGSEPLIIRDHRLIELTFCPVQYNPVTGMLIVFSQMVVRIEYASPAQIRPVRESLRSEVFETILKNSLLYYDSCHEKYRTTPGISTSISRIPAPPPPMPTATVPMFQQSSIPAGYELGAEYLIITNESLRLQAQRLAEWKEQKGIPSRVETVDLNVPRTTLIQNIKGLIQYAYDHWYPAPSYVVLFGDVEIIPTNYDMQHTYYYRTDVKFFPDMGYFASDLAYFTVQGNSFFPDIIYSRISVDTEEQAEIIVDKIINYEQSPTEDDTFYTDLLSVGYFQDKSERDGNEDAGGPFLYHLENIRHYLKNQYNVHYNYSCAIYDQLPVNFVGPINSDPWSRTVTDYIPSNYRWLAGYDDHQVYQDDANNAIISNINEGRFLVMYYSHGGSKNMKYSVIKEYSTDNRDITEGWHTPCFNTSYFHLLDNENKLPLVLSIACSTGWFDGETDQLSCRLLYSEGQDFDGNAFAMYNGESFAENLTRLRGGALAVFAPSRPVPSLICADLLDGVIRTLWPGFQESQNQPIYEIGGALFAAKLYAADECIDIYTHRDRAQMIYEGFHLFGDPETQIWTDIPSEFSVSYPENIGTQDPQKFVVTVKDSFSQNPVSNAKICIQQDPFIYQVGYTDSNGQVLFKINPPDRIWHLNVTVTKHNYIPHINSIGVVKGTDVAVSTSPDYTVGGLENVNINVTGFNEDDYVNVLIDEMDPIQIWQGSHLEQISIPQGSTGYLNVIALQGESIATNVIYRLSSDQNPDPFIYSYNDPSTWFLADNELVWDNPCISIYFAGRQVQRVNQGWTYDVNVTIHNRGDGDASNTLVTLSSGPFGGGISWNEIANTTVSIPLFESRDVSFKWIPQSSDTACLKVTIHHGNEIPDDTINNVGTECWNIFPLCSIGESLFDVGNPSDDTNYVLINVKQEGDYEDVWGANVQGYTSQPIDSLEKDSATLVVDPGHDLTTSEGRTFSAEIYVNDELVGGMEFTGFCDRYTTIYWVILILIVFFVVLAIIFYYVLRDDPKSSQPIDSGE